MSDQASIRISRSEQGQSNCLKCPEKLDRRAWAAGFQGWELCGKCCHERHTLESDRRWQERSSRVDDLMCQAGFPPLLVSFEVRIPDAIRPAVPRLFPKRPTPLSGLFVSGPAGVGKTGLVTSLARAWFNDWARSPADMPTLLDDGKNPWKFLGMANFLYEFSMSGLLDRPKFIPEIRAAAQAPFLIMDDLPAAPEEEYVCQGVFYILEERLVNHRPTFITSNSTLSEVKLVFGERVTSRILGLCRILEIQGRDQRVENEA